MTDKLIEQIKEENEALKEAVCNAYLRGVFEERRKRIPAMESRILADAEVIEAAEELVKNAKRNTPEGKKWRVEGIDIVWLDEALTTFRQAQQARAEKGGE